MNKTAEGNIWIALGIIICGILIIASFIHLTWDFWSQMGNTLYGGSGFFGFD